MDQPRIASSVSSSSRRPPRPRRHRCRCLPSGRRQVRLLQRLLRFAWSHQVPVDITYQVGAP